MISSTEITTAVESAFLKETLEGLYATPKYMHSKYFYDKIGDFIFQQIMAMEEYYLTNAEMEIMKDRSKEIVNTISCGGAGFELIELGCGDISKSIHLLKTLLDANVEFTYIPIDISKNVIDNIEWHIPKTMPELNYMSLNGDYLDMLSLVSKISERKKVVLFMGANIGNMSPELAQTFLNQLKTYLSKDDILITGFDLKKNPAKILAAYNDANGITRSFNLNLLSRINKELGGDFDISKFEHYPTYDPRTGACRSFLVSLEDQTAHIGSHKIEFKNGEDILMEISQKYSLEEIQLMASVCGFQILDQFQDGQNYFVDSVWTVI